MLLCASKVATHCHHQLKSKCNEIVELLHWKQHRKVFPKSSPVVSNSNKLILSDLLTQTQESLFFNFILHWVFTHVC